MSDRPSKIYMDYMATTPIDERVIEVMLQYMGLEGQFANPSSDHAMGHQAIAAVEQARATVADILGASAEEIIWTSGATESNNIALLGAARFYQNKGRHIITCVTEHHAVLDPCEQLEKEGFRVTYLKPRADGLLDLEALANALNPETILVSIMHANNEIGVIQGIQAIAELTRNNHCLLHVDASQSVGKLALDLQQTPIDLLSFSGHKIYGPKGVGALFVRRKPRVRLQPLVFGGGQERGMRSGTLATHQIVGLAEALKLCDEEREQEAQRLLHLRQRLWQGLQTIEHVRLNGAWQPRLPGNLNVSFGHVNGEALLHALEGLSVSSGSACTSALIEPSHVLRGIGVTQEWAQSAIRFSLGRYTTEAEVDAAIAITTHAVAKLRATSLAWEALQCNTAPLV